MPTRKVWPNYQVGDHVFVSGRSAVLVEDMGNQRWMVRYADGTTGQSYVFFMAFRSR